jgi:hypothetical protein
LRAEIAKKHIVGGTIDSLATKDIADSVKAVSALEEVYAGGERIFSAIKRSQCRACGCQV